MLAQNTLVVYKNMPAVITAAGDKYTIAYLVPAAKAGKPPEKKELKVRAKDISVLTAANTQSVAQLAKAAEHLAPSFRQQLDDIYELLTADGGAQPEPALLSDIAGLCGADSGAAVWALYTVLCEDPRFMQTQTETDADSAAVSFMPRSQEEAAARAAKETLKKQETQERAAFIARLKARKLSLPQDERFMQEVEAVALGQTEHSKAMKDAGIAETPEQAHKLLLDTGVWTVLRNPYPARLGLSARSATECLISPPEEERTAVPGTAYAIDNAWSADPDDAIAFDGTYLWVHIADPAAAVEPDSRIDKAARRRGATLYLPEGTARMLAENALEDYALGLTPVSRALSFRISLDENGAISGCSVLKTTVSVRRLTYEQADELCGTPELQPLFDIAERNMQRRKKAGAVSITLPEVHIRVTDGAVSIETLPQTKSSSVVREAMLLAGEAAARFAFKNDIPFPFVSQEAPDIPADIPAGLAGQYRLRRCMRSRSVGVTPASHSGLGLSMYSQVTSPLRRYADLAAHQQLRAFIDKKPLLDTDTMLEHIAAGDAAAGASVKAERKSRLHWTLVYLLQHPDWTGDAVAVEKKGRQYVFLIPELAQETVFIPQKELALNETVRVKAGNISIPSLTVTFQEL